MTTRPLALFALALLVAPAAPAPGAADDTKSDAPKVTFETVRPILTKRCAKCHTGERPRGELDVTTFGAIMQGGVSGKAVVAGKPADSPLYTLTAHLEDPKMPPNSPKIPQTELDALRKWIEDGLVEKAGTAAATTSVTPPNQVPDGITKAEPMPRATPVTALAVAPAAPLLAVPGKNQVLVHDLATGKLLGGLPFPEGEVHALRFSRDGKLLLAAGGVGGQSGAVVGFEVGTWKRRFAVADDTDAVLAADVSADGTRVVFGGPGRVVKVVSVPDGKVLHTLRKPTDWVLSVAFSPEGLLVAAGDRFGGLYAWEAKSGKEFAVLRGHTKAVAALAWRADSDALASASEDGTVRVWDLHTATESAKWEAHPEGALDVAWHAAGALATAGRDGRVRVWDQKGKKVADLGPAGDAVLRVGFAPDAKAVVAGDWSGRVSVWPVAGGEPVHVALPLLPKAATVTLIPVPTPALPIAAVRPGPAPLAVGAAALQAELARKRAALKAVEDAAEKLKDEAAHDPKNAALAKAYLQLCEAALAVKAGVVETEAALAAAKEVQK